MIVLRRPAPRSALLLSGLCAALAMRLAVAGPDGERAAVAGTAFAFTLLALGLAAGWRPAAPALHWLALGIGGAAVLALFPLALKLTHPSAPVLFPAAGWPLWAAVVSAVALTEEILLRGVLFTSLQRLGGPVVAVALTSLAFAALHVPLYGWGIFPLDLAVGVWLGGLRLLSGGVAAPATAHVLADLTAWWLM